MRKPELKKTIPVPELSPTLLKVGHPLTILHKTVSVFVNAYQSHLAPGVADRALGLIRARNVVGILELVDEVSSQCYETLGSHFAATQLCAFLSKYPYPPEMGGPNRRAAAVSSFMSAERRCARTNLRLLAYRNRSARGTKGCPHYFRLNKAREWIERVIGREPDYDALFEECDFSGGASLGVHGSKTNFARKLLSKTWTTTARAQGLAFTAMWRNEHFRELLLTEGGPFYCADYSLLKERCGPVVTLVTHNKIDFVPKSAKTDRSIALEPLLNGYLQKGVDVVLRKHLKRAGFDLSNQGVNQLYALRGSLTGAIACIDLSAASDSMSTELIRYLLPPAWYALLLGCRSPDYELNGEVRPYHKFVSMGNGFCFPLETLVFASLCVAVGANDFTVYGDDIALERDLALELVELLRYVGFVTNVAKSDFVGPFRESCGAQWYEGQDVRPVYVRRPLTSAMEIMVLHNALIRNEWLAHLDWSFLRNTVDSKIRFLKPIDDETDGAFIVPMDVFMGGEFTRWERRKQQWEYLELVVKPVRDPLPNIPLSRFLEYIAVLKGSSSRAPLSLRFNNLVTAKRKACSGPYKSCTARSANRLIFARLFG